MFFVTSRMRRIEDMNRLFLLLKRTFYRYSEQILLFGFLSAFCVHFFKLIKKNIVGGADRWAH